MKKPAEKKLRKAKINVAEFYPSLPAVYVIGLYLRKDNADASSSWPILGN